MVHTNVYQLRKAKGVTNMASMLGISLQGYGHIELGNVRLM
ncbi:hypothetical protein [Brevibacillus brevis]|nr:hypothetical protein [Brevibacillus brevis]